MLASKSKFSLNSREVLFQVLLHLLVFTFYSFDKNQPTIEAYHVAFFANYAVAAFFINYFFLPRFYYQKKYLQFFLLTLLTVAGAILVEELVMERIFFPDTRGRTFQGFFFTLLDVLPVITIISGFKFAWDALYKQRELDALKAAIEESELQYLTSQVNPHFLFNNLNNLYAYAIENSPKTPTIILELSAVLRYMLYECREKFVPLSKEIEHLQNFTRLNELQIEERGEVHFESSGSPSAYQIAPLILIVFVENAFKHSQASQSEDIQIAISIAVSPEGMLDFTCKNNFEPTTNTDNLSHGIGLANVKKRLQLLYPDAHQLHIREDGKQYEVNLRLQLNPQNQA